MPSHDPEEATLNMPLPIGRGQTISQPLTVAFMLELLQPGPGHNVLDVGAGSGWTTALLAFLVGEKGKVLALERIPELAETAQRNLEKYHFSNITVTVGDGTLGSAKDAPFDRIHVAAATAIVPQPLKDQLTIGGRMVIPVGDGLQTMYLMKKTGAEQFVEKHYPGFSFVPLIEGPVP